MNQSNPPGYAICASDCRSWRAATGAPEVRVVKKLPKALNVPIPAHIRQVWHHVRNHLEPCILCQPAYQRQLSCWCTMSGFESGHLCIATSGSTAQASTFEPNCFSTQKRPGGGAYWKHVFTAATEWPLFVSRATSCLLYTSPSPRDRTRSRMPSSA